MQQVLRWASLCCLLLFAVACGNPTSAGDDGVSPTPTESPTPTLPPNSVGCRDINISEGLDGTGPDASGYYTSAIGANTDTSEFIDAQGWNVGGPLTLCAGPLTDDKAEVTLATDVVFAVSLPLNNCLCRDYRAQGTVGSLYCAAHSDPLDYTLSINSNGSASAGAATPVDGNTVDGEGHVRMAFMSAATNIDANAAACTPEACATALSAVTANPVIYTTGAASSEWIDSVQGGDEVITANGKPFDDDPADGVADCEDWVDNAASLGAFAGAPEHDEDNNDLGLQDVVTIEQIAE